MNGPQIVSRAYLSFPLASSWQIVGIADFSGDKLADILWYNESTKTGLLSVWGSWLGIQSTAELFRSSSPGDVVAIGDADGNGLPDVVTRHPDSGRMRVWFTQLEWSVPKAKTSADLDTAAFTPVDGAPEPLASFEVQGGSDYDGDGRMDLAVRDPAAGDLRVWFLDAATVRGGSPVDGSRAGLVLRERRPRDPRNPPLVGLSSARAPPGPPRRSPPLAARIGTRMAAAPSPITIPALTSVLVSAAITIEVTATCGVQVPSPDAARHRERDRVDVGEARERRHRVEPAARQVVLHQRDHQHHRGEEQARSGSPPSD